VRSVRSHLPAWLAAASLLMLTGCGAAPAVLLGDDQTRLLVSGDANSLGAPLSGTLVILQGGCLGIDNGTAPSLVAWPPGTTFAGGDTVGIRLPEGRVIRVGDTVRTDGGRLDSADPATPARPGDCQGSEIFTVSDVVDRDR
jgi:hypothetical protein